jgi:hypothetical protein
MGSIRRPGRNFQPAPDDKRTRDVEPGFNAIGNQDIGVTEHAAQNLCHRENRIHDHTEERDPRARLPGRRSHPARRPVRLQIVCGGVRMLGRGHHENYKRSRVRNARKSRGRVTCRITTMADAKRW